MDKEGILVGCDAAQDWLLPWFYRHLRKHCSLPITFANFGMRDGAIAWCKERGKILTVDQSLVQEPSWEMLIDWHQIYNGELARHVWFKKPLAMAKSPYEKTLWLDLDCEVRDDLSPLFHYDFAIGADPERCQREGEPWIYNSGVMVFSKNHPFIQSWVYSASERAYMGDQDALSAVLEGKQFHELDPVWNWRPFDGENERAKIVHYVAAHGKRALAQMICADTDLTASIGAFPCPLPPESNSAPE